MEYNSGLISPLKTYSLMNTIDTMTNLQLQLNPSPVYPWLHAHSMVPGEVTLHSALTSQGLELQATYMISKVEN